jgi:hypothetical protein
MTQFLDFARCSAEAAQLPELLRSLITSLEQPPETRVDLPTVQRTLRRGSNRTSGEKDKEGG